MKINVKNTLKFRRYGDEPKAKFSIFRIFQGRILDGRVYTKIKNEKIGGVYKHLFG